MQILVIILAFVAQVWSECSGEYTPVTTNANSGVSIARYVIDDEPSTSWISDSDETQWITLDLGALRTVGGVKIAWGNAFASDYDIRYSLDGSSFYTAYSDVSSSGGDVEHSFTPVQARYVGMDLNTMGAFYSYYQIYSYEVYSSCNDDIVPDDGRSTPAVIPKPTGVVLGNAGSWGATDGIELASDTYSQQWAGLVGTYLIEAGMSSTGTPFTISLDTGLDVTLGEEGYELDISSDGITLKSSTELGSFYGLQSLRQIWMSGEDHAAMTITDKPANSWRGLMLDPARNFIPLEYLEKTIDRMSILKLNRLHLHLTDDQGWRIEIKSYPKLHEIGSQSSTEGNPGYYTQDEYKDLVTYAEQRGVIIVPEIDLPGHTHAVKATYPEYGCGSNYPWPYTGTQVGFSKLCLTHADIKAFVGAILDEVIEMTPGEWIHIGGDEIEDTGYADFITWLDTYVTAKGKTMVGWQEVRSGSLSTGSIFQQWKTTGSTSGGQPWINSTCTYGYIDHPETLGGDGLTWCRDRVTDQNVYSLTAGTEGIEVALWGELMSDTSVLSDRIYPRLYSAAEAGWTPSAEKNWSDFLSRRTLLDDALAGEIEYGIVTLSPTLRKYLPVSRANGQFDFLGRRLSSEQSIYIQQNQLDGQIQNELVIQPR